MAKKDTPPADPVVSKTGSTTLSHQVVARWEALDEAASYWLSMWQTLATYIMPRKAFVLQKQVAPNLDKETQLFDTTGVRANQVLAAGIMSYVNDAASDWVQLTAPEGLDEAEGVEEYYAECSRIILQELARSNAYTTLHEAYLDRGCFGTCALSVEAGDGDAILQFRTFDVGSFRISENAAGYIDTILIKREMTIRQLVEEYGISNVSEQSKRDFLSSDGKSLEKKVEVIQEIRPRTDTERLKGKRDPENKPIASIHVEMGAKKLLRNSGYDEQPFFVSRYLKWQQSSYGWSPAWVALPDCKQLNFLQKQMDALAELAAFPRLLIPEGMSGEPDLRAGGITYFDASSPQEMPKEWATQGRYDIGQDRIKMKQQHIEDAFNVPLFQMFAQEDMQSEGSPITATQVRAMESEKLVMINPTYSRLTTELLIPVIRRIYGIMSRLGMMPEVPQALVQQHPSGDPSLAFVPEPKVIFNNKMSIAVNARSVDAIDPVIQETLQVCQITQDMSPMDNFDMDAIARKKTISRGSDPDFLRKKEDMQGIRQNRAQQAAQQAQMQQQAHMADMASKLGGVRQDSPAAPMIKQHLNS